MTSNQDKARRVVRVILITLFSVAILFPVFYMFSSSLFSPRDFLELRILPSSPRFSNWKKAVSQRYFPMYLLNSGATSVIAALVRCAVTVLAAFAFTHYTFRGSGVLFALLVVTLFVPSEAVLYQNYRTVASLGLLDSWLGIVSTSVFSASHMLIAMGCFKAMGREMYDAARIDGAGDGTYILHILLPQSAAVLMSIIVQTVVTVFNSYLWPLLVTSRPRSRTVQIGLTLLGFTESGETGAAMAAVAIVSLPFLILLLFTKKGIEKALIRK